MVEGIQVWMEVLRSHVNSDRLPAEVNLDGLDVSAKRGSRLQQNYFALSVK